VSTTAIHGPSTDDALVTQTLYVIFFSFVVESMSAAFFAP
jgi:hypothetical protein